MDANELLINQYLDGELDEAQQAQLGDWLLADDENCRVFAAWTFEDRLVRDTLLGQTSVASLIRDEATARESAQSRSKGEPAQTATSPIVTARASRIDWRRHPVRFGTFALAATVCFWGVFYIWILPQNGESDHFPVSASRGLAQIVGLKDVVWRKGDTLLQVGSELEKDQPLGFDAGLVEIELVSGARAIVVGPAEFRVVGKNALFLESGKIAATVQQQAAGFTVNTFLVTVTDLGTEFDVTVIDSEQVQVHVFQGEVVLAQVGKPATLSRRLRAGESLTVRSAPDGKYRTEDLAMPKQRFAKTEDVTPRRVLLSVRSNSGLRYAVASSGLAEDCSALTDRDYQWNGVSEVGIPAELIGAEYVQTAMDDKANRNLEVEVKVAGPATLYVFVTDAERPPAWLTDSFTNTGKKIGMDTDAGRLVLGRGAAQSIDFTYSVWRRTVADARLIRLGPAQTGSDKEIGIYGIAAVPLNDSPTNTSQ